MKPLRKVLTLAAAAVIAAGCSDAASTGDPLPQADAEEVTEALVLLGTADFDETFHRAHPDLPPGLSLAPSDEFTRSLTGSRPCVDASGTVALAGNVKLTTNENNTEASLDFDYTVTPTNCRVMTESAKQYTVSGDPSIKVSGGLDALLESSNSGSISGSLKYEGGFIWEGAEGAAGGCKFNVTVEYDFEASETSFSGSVTAEGKVCGYDVTYTETVDFNQM